MSLIAREELSGFLAANGNRFINEAGTEITSYEEWGIGSSLKFYEGMRTYPGQ